MHFYKSTPKFLEANYEFPEVTKMAIFIKVLDGCFWVYRFSLEKYLQYFIIAQSEPMSSQLSTPVVLLSCSYILPASWQKDKCYMGRITFTVFSCVFQVMMSLSTITGVLPD